MAAPLGRRRQAKECEDDLCLFRYSIATMAVGLLITVVGAFAEERECSVPERFYAFEPPLTKTAKALAGRREVVIAALGGASTMGVAAGGLEFAWPARLASALAEKFRLSAPR